MAKKQTQSLEFWKQQIARGLEYQRKYGNSDDWKKWDGMYAGVYAGLEYSGTAANGRTRPHYPMNFMFAQFRSLVPQIYFRNPTSSVISRRPGMNPHARVLQTILDWLISEMATKTQLKRAALDTMLYGTGFIKQGYDSEYGTDPNALVSGQFQTEAGDIQLAGESLTQRDPDTFERLEYNATIQPGRPWAVRVHPRDILVDPLTVDPMLDDAQWVIHRVLRRMKDVKADAKYEKSDKKDLKPTRSENYSAHDEPRLYDDHSTARTNDGDDRIGDIPPRDPARGKSINNDKDVIDEWVELWEIHDRKTERVMVLNLDHDKWLRDTHDHLQFDGLPFVPIIFNAHPKSFWGISDAQMLHPQQIELNETRKMQRNYRRASLVRFLLKKGALTPTQIQSFFSDEPNMMLEISGEFPNIGEAMQQVQGFMPPDLGLWGGQIMDDMRQILGTGRNQMGQFDNKTHRSATEASIVQANSQIRVDERRDVLADVLSRVLRRSAQMLWKWWDVQQVARVAGPGGQQFWVNYTGQELKGEYDFNIQPDDATPLTNRQRLQDLTQLAQTVAPMLQPEQAQQLVAAILRVADGVDEEEILQVQQPQQDPMSLDQFGGQLQSQAVQAQGKREVRALQAEAEGAANA